MKNVRLLKKIAVLGSLILTSQVFGADIFFRSLSMTNQDHFAAKRCQDGSYIIYNNSNMANVMSQLDAFKSTQTYQNAKAAGAQVTATACDFKAFGGTLPNVDGLKQYDTKDIYIGYESEMTSNGTDKEVLRLNTFEVQLTIENHSETERSMVQKLHKCLLMLQAGKVDTLYYRAQQDAGNPALYDYTLRSTIN